MLSVNCPYAGANIEEYWKGHDESRPELRMSTTDDHLNNSMSTVRAFMSEQLDVSAKSKLLL